MKPRRKDVAATLAEVVRQAFGPDARIGHINWGDSHAQMLAYNRRCERAFKRSRRNQPPKEKQDG